MASNLAERETPISAPTMLLQLPLGSAYMSCWPTMEASRLLLERPIRGGAGGAALAEGRQSEGGQHFSDSDQRAREQH